MEKSTGKLVLPRPIHKYDVHEDKVVNAPAIVPQKDIPKYRHRKGYRPVAEEDFGDGGAFPEIIMAQYPLGMGRKGPGTGNKAKTLALTNAQGHDAIVKQDRSGDGKVYSKFTDLIQRNSTVDMNERLREPSKAEQEETAQRTSEALAKIVGRKVSATKPVKVPDNQAANESLEKPVYIKYSGAGAGATDRVIRMVEAPVDPLELPKFKLKKQPRAAAEQPVPIMHSQAKKLTPEDQANWKIPPCISNWKNPKGHTIPLDKRLVADGRGLEDHSINDKFAKLSEALYIAENQARVEIESRNKARQHIMMKAKERREEELREMAAKARQERDQEMATTEQRRETVRKRLDSSDDDDDDDDIHSKQKGSHVAPSSDDDEDEGAKEREKLRLERKRQRERELRLAAAGKKTKLARDEERDVSERVALGMAVPKTGAGGAESQYDGRLFNQSHQGLGSGFGEESDYNVYSKPLFQANTQQYRAKQSAESQFGTADEQLAQLKARSGPVQFEKEDDKAFSKLLSGTSKEHRQVGSKLDESLSAGGGGNRQGRGFLHAVAGNTEVNSKTLSSKRTIQFQSASSSK